MANTKISNLPSAGALAGTEPLPIVQGGATKQTTVQDIANLAGGNQSLNDVLVVGNETLGTNIKVNDADAIELENASLLKKGTYDFGGLGGISRICSVGYEDMWQSGIHHVFDNNGWLRESTNCFNYVPDSTFDSSLRFQVGSRWILDDGTTYVCLNATPGSVDWELISNVPTLEDVNDSGGQGALNNSKYGDVANLLMLVGVNNIQYLDVPNTFDTSLQFDAPTAAGGMLKLPDTAGYSKTLATTDQIPSGGGGIPHASASGTDTYTATITGVTAYNDGDSYLIRFPNGNTSSATLNINSIGAVDLYRNNDGSLIGGDIIAGGEMLCIYNSTTNAFQLIGTAPNTLLAYVTNADSVSITKGQVVYAFGGQGDRMTVKRANNSSEATSSRTVGVVLSTSIAANQKGIIIIQGLLDGLSILPTSTFADGDSLYLSSTAGSITNVKPTAPNNLVYLGVVTTANNGSSGRWYVKVQNGYELNELHDVSITSIANNQVLQYDSATTLWKNKSLTTASVAASTDKNYVTDAQATIIGNTSGTNSGNETTTTIGTLINGATSKTTPVDADQVGLMDSAASNILKKLSWANIKATLKTYFDTLYLTASNNLSELTNTTTARTNLGLDLLLPILAETCTDGAIVGNGGTGTTNNTYTGGVLITPSMIAADTTIEVLAGFRKSAANGASTIRIYANTTNDIAGSPILIGQALYAAGVLYSAQSRQLRIKVKNGTGAGTEVLNTSINSVFSDLSNMTVAASNLAIDWTTNKYIVVSLQLGVATATTGDSARSTFIKVRR